MLQKCIKLRIIKPAGEQDTWKDLSTVFHETSYVACKAANYVMRDCYLKAIAKAAGEDVGKRYCYPVLTTLYPQVARHIISTMERVAAKKWSATAKDVLKAKVSLPTFRRDLPVHLHHEGYELLKSGNDYIIDAQMQSTKAERTRYQFVVAAKDHSTKTILGRILDKTYRKGTGQLFADRKGKWYFVIPYQFQATYHNIDKNKIMGVDLGITKAAYWAFNDSHKRGWIEGGEIAEFRRRVRSRRIQIQHQGQYCGSGRIGHGTARRLLPIDVLSEKETNFRDTCNHRYARRIVDEALRMKCGVIQMEDLTHIAKDSKFLSNWSYFDLQTKIINKAAEYGIEVCKKNPEYTSQRCSQCGYIDKANRPDQGTFVCTKCGYGNMYHCFACGSTQPEMGACQKCGEATRRIFINADYNAARNLATAEIDALISAQLCAETMS